MAVVYTHTRLDTNQVFYVGIGLEEKRAYQKKFRNAHWKAIVEKHGYSVDILNVDIEWAEACEIEKYLIAKYKRKCEGGALCNLTIGGDGVVGMCRSEDHRKKISDGNKGKKRTEEQRINISKGRTGIVFSEEHRKNISIGKTGKKLAAETCAKMSNSRKKPVIDLVTGIVYGCMKDACDGTGENIFYHKYRINRPNMDRRFIYA
jgi:hypothetical protein